MRVDEFMIARDGELELGLDAPGEKRLPKFVGLLRLGGNRVAKLQMMECGLVVDLDRFLEPVDLG